LLLVNISDERSSGIVNLRNLSDEGDRRNTILKQKCRLVASVNYCILQVH
jgi:hypothetical protein